jgi:serine/threonine-protein kinase
VDELNRDLLVVVLALLTGAIPRSGLNAALKSWTKDRRQSLTSLLKKEAGLDASRLDALECLAEAHLRTHQNDLRLSLDAWHAHELTQDFLTEIADDALRTTFNTTLGGDETVPGPGDASGFTLGDPSQTDSPPRAERFRLIRPHAQGGIGQVWVARDCELQREVALKVIQDRYAERQDQRDRFVLEAEITGNLEHPGIVPVYSLGRNEKGRPYYAMRFIRGESFSVAIRRFHKEWREQSAKERKRRGSQWGVEFRQLLGRFLDVCDAMDYAHSRDVLHRDLKPANIMLGRYGETLVVDWGLAKVLGKADVIAEPADAEREGEFEPSLAGASSVAGDTQPGMTIGTPSYMSPEQARGAIEELGPASDVYSLGATLYELLTGAVAFPGEKPSQIIQKVLKGDFRPPRAVYRPVPPPLEAICLKAMAFLAAERYASVRALARDIEHWLADEPVSAYKERPIERLSRWMRQHRTWTYAAAASLIGVSVVATAAAVVIEHSRQREAAVRQEAENNFAIAQKAVDDYLTNVSENILLKEQDSVDLRNMRRDLLQKGLNFYEQFVAQRGDDPLLRRELANAYIRVGDVTQEIASAHQALVAYNSARTIWESLVEANPKEPGLRGRLANCYLAIGKLQLRMQNLQGAMKSLASARAILEPLASSDPADLSYQSSLAECYSQIGIVQSELESEDHGLDMLQKARAIQQVLIARAPATLAYRKTEAAIVNYLGFAHYKRHDLPAALRSFHEVCEICQSLLDRAGAGPKPVDLLHLLALGLYNIGAIEWENKHIDEALRAFEQSLSQRSALAAAHPSVNQYQVKLGVNYRDIAWVQHRAKQEEKAFASLQKSLDVFGALVKSQPEQAGFLSELGKTWSTLGVFHDAARQHAAAISAFKQAVAVQTRAIELSQDADAFTTDLCRDLENIGEKYVDEGKVAEALPHYRQAIQIRTQLRKAHPEARAYALDLEQALSRLGTIQRHAGDSAAALDLFSQAQAVLEDRATPASPGDGTLETRLAIVLTRKAATLMDLQNQEAARPLLQRAVASVSSRAASSHATAEERECESEAFWELARVLRALGRPTDADRADHQRTALWKDRPPGELVELALKEAARAASIGYGKTEVSRQGQSVRQLDLDQAAANVILAVDHGFSDLPMLRSRPEAEPLLARDDVKASLAKRELPKR